MESRDAAAGAGPSQPPGSAGMSAQGQGQGQQPGCVADQAAAAAQYFAARAAAGVVLTDREHLSDLEHKLLQARLRFQDLKEEKCKASSKGCGCRCCPHEYARPRDQNATSLRSGPDSRSISETSNQPRKAGGGRQHLTRSVRSLSSSHQREHHQQQQLQPQPQQPQQQQQDATAEHGSPNSEGLLLAVDKFLSMK